MMKAWMWSGRIRRWCSSQDSVDWMRTSDFFQLLHDAEVTYRVDLEKLTRRYKDLQKRWHPDRPSLGDKVSSEEDVAQVSARINMAYQTLRSPHLRAQYLLEKVGHPVREGDQGPTDPEVLAKAMDLHEAIEAAKDDPDRLEELRRAHREEFNKLDEALADAFARKEYIVAKDLAFQVRYMRRLEDRLHALLPAS